MASEHVTGEPDPSTYEGRRMIIALNMLNQTMEKNQRFANPAQQSTNIQQYGFTGGPTQQPPSAAPKSDPDRGLVRGIVQAIIDGFRKVDAKAKSITPPTIKGLFVGKERAAKSRKFLGRVAKGVRQGWRSFRDDVKKSGLRKAMQQRKNGGHARGVKRPGSIAGKASGAILGQLFSKLSLVLLPLSMLATFLGSAASGFGTFSKVMNLFVGVLAPMLLPILFLLAAGLVAVSDVLWRHLLPAFGKFFSFMLTHGVPVLEKFVNAIEKIVNFIAEITGNEKDKNAAGPGGILPPGEKSNQFVLPNKDADMDVLRGHAIKQWETRLKAEEDFKAGKITAAHRDQIVQMEEEFYKRFKESPDDARKMFVTPRPDNVTPGTWHPTLKDDAPKRPNEFPFIEQQIIPNPRAPGEAAKPGAKGPDGAPIAGPGPAGMGGMKGIFTDLLRSFKLDNGPKASMTGLANVGSEKLMQALNQDPFEQKMLDRMQKMIDLMQKAIEAMPDDQPMGVFNANPGGK